MQANAPIRSRPPDRSVRVEAPAHRPTDQQQGTTTERASHTLGQADRQRLDPLILSQVSHPLGILRGMERDRAVGPYERSTP
jgi:hypothetical protein